MSRENRGGDPPADRSVEIKVAGSGPVPGLLRRTESSRVLLVLAHGAGAGMRHAFMAGMADRLADRGVATLRYQFPYMEAGSRRPDRAPIAHATVRAAVAVGRELAEGLPLFAGGKSFGGRMTSGAAAESPLDGVSGLVFLGFPLHPAGRPGTDRAEHLHGVDLPMLFVQGTRDALADLDLLWGVIDELGQGSPRDGRVQRDHGGDRDEPDRPTAGIAVHVVEGADHSFKVLKRSGRTDDEVLDEIGDAVREFVFRALP